MPDLRLGVGSEDGVEPGAGMLEEETRGVEGGRSAIAPGSVKVHTESVHVLKVCAG